MAGIAASHVWLNGRLIPSDAAHLSVYDRGFQLGDGVFEALRARRGVAIELAGHLARLHGSLAAMGYEIAFTDAEVASGIEELLAAERMDGVEPLEAEAGALAPGGAAAGAAPAAGAAVTPGDAVVRITVSRGFDPTRSVKPNAGTVATVAIQAWPFSPPSAYALQEGERFITSAIHRDAESPMAGIKTTSRAELVYARLEAERAGADDAIFLTVDGRITEATTSNVLLITGAVCATPRLGTALLPGTTRAWLVDNGREAGLEMVECDLTLDDAFAADEMAICASIGGVIPVTSLNGRQIGDGRPGARTMALRGARESYIDRVSIEGAKRRLALESSAAGH
jgi:branched-subunit amino acid aminotransferase/4-amino-4-deoxychorismate lyase